MIDQGAEFKTHWRIIAPYHPHYVKNEQEHDLGFKMKLTNLFYQTGTKNGLERH